MLLSEPLPLQYKTFLVYHYLTPIITIITLTLLIILRQNRGYQGIFELLFFAFDKSLT